jgi:hypothetical protein
MKSGESSALAAPPAIPTIHVGHDEVFRAGSIEPPAPIRAV